MDKLGDEIRMNSHFSTIKLVTEFIQRAKNTANTFLFSLNLNFSSC